MADLSITATNVTKDSTVSTANEDRDRVGGEQIEAGEVYYVDSTDSKAKLAQHDNVDADAAAYAMAVNTCEVDGQDIRGVREGLVTIGTHGATIGTPYFLSATPGKIAPIADVTIGTNKTKLVGIISSATQIYVNLKVPAYPTD